MHTITSEPRRKSRARRVIVGIVAVIALLGLGAAVGWAAATVLRPVEDPTVAQSHTLVEVVPGEVESSLRLSTSAEWTLAPAGANRASGTVTGVSVSPGDEVSQGAILYRVDQRPVVIAQGDVPMYRDIGVDARGADVRQLQQLLKDLGFYTLEVDGVVRWGTMQAIMAWQKELGVAQSGSVEVGDVIFVPKLPTRVSLDGEKVKRGLTLSGGEQVVSVLPDSPAFSVAVTEAQAGMVATGTRVEITNPDGGIWEAVAADQVPNTEDGSIRVTLTGVGDQPICGDACELVPVSGRTLLDSQIVIVEPTEGLVVPSAALVTGADGQAAVIDEAGVRIPVTIVASARGMSVVEGVVAGTQVQLPAGDS